MESNGAMVETFDRASEMKAFDQTQIGIKGLIDGGITKIPNFFINPLASLRTTIPTSTSVTVPTIDFEGGVFESSATRERVLARVKDAVENFGIFQAINHGIPLDVMEKMEAGIRQFHEKDPELKKMFHSRDINKKVKYFTNYDLFDAPAGSWRDTLTCFLYPDPPKPEELPEICRDVTMEYSKLVMKFGELIFELLSEALGLSPNHLKDMGCGEGLMMLNHYYPPCPEPDLTIGVPKHTDKCFITVLLQDHIGGLQILRDGYWVDVLPTKGALVVNIGDLLQLISNDKFVSVEHVVWANRAKEGRVSVASFFVHPPLSSRVYGPIKELLSEENPPKYKETTAEGPYGGIAVRKAGKDASLSDLRI